MPKVLKVAGGILLAIGSIALVAFVVFILQDEAFAKARMLMSRNPGNVMYETEYFVRFTIRAFLVSGAASGGLLALNGGTMLLLGKWAARLEAMPASRDI